MIEPIMFVEIGFLVAGLLVIGVIPLVHARAVRLTQRRLEALTPLSMAEIQADKDQLRAEFAMSTRRLEMSVEQMKAKTSSQLAEIGKKSEAIGRLKFELSEKTASLFAAEAKEKQLADELALYRTDTEIKSTALEDAERALAATQAELAQATANFNEASVTADSQRVELVMLRAQAEALKGQIESYEKETKELHGRLSRQTAEIDSLGQQLSEERNKAETLGNRVGELDRLLIAQNHGGRDSRPPRAGAGRPARRAGPLPRRPRIRLGPPAHRGGQRAEDRSRRPQRALRGRAPPPPPGDRGDPHRETLLEEQLKQSQDERAKLQREMATMKRDAETAWASSAWKVPCCASASATSPPRWRG